MDKKSKNSKVKSKSAEKKPKAKTEVKVDKKQKDFERLEEYLNESGLYLAFNIIFAELISKQILAEKKVINIISLLITKKGKMVLITNIINITNTSRDIPIQILFVKIYTSMIPAHFIKRTPKKLKN